MQPHAEAHDRKDVPARPEWILALAGFCLILLQFFMIREVTSLLHGTELVILLVTVAYFSGYSVGYAVAGQIAPRRLKPLLLAGWALHLTIPFSFRYIGGWLTEDASVAALAGLLFLTAFLLSSFFSVLLPLLIDAASDGAQSLVRYYSIELLGALAAPYTAPKGLGSAGPITTVP